MSRIKMTVGAIAIDKNGDPIVLLNDEEQQRALPIWVGLLEARAISLTSQNVKTKRPLTHQLIINTIQRLGYSVKEILIDATAESDGYTASIVLSSSNNNSGGDGTVSIEARPSDAIALAIMSDLPVLVDGEVVAQSSLPIRRHESDDRKAFKNFVDNLKASDFKSTEPIELPNDNVADWPEAS
jgi:uncharacterized protein